MHAYKINYFSPSTQPLRRNIFMYVVIQFSLVAFAKHLIIYHLSDQFKYLKSVA